MNLYLKKFYPQKINKIKLILVKFKFNNSSRNNKYRLPKRN